MPLALFGIRNPAGGGQLWTASVLFIDALKMCRGPSHRMADVNCDVISFPGTVKRGIGIYIRRTTDLRISSRQMLLPS
jgi:hypothetical protein